MQRDRSPIRRVDLSQNYAYIDHMTFPEVHKTHGAAVCGHDHDHGEPCGSIEAAADICESHNVRLTPARRQILELLCAAGHALGAYELIEKVAQASGKRPAPISVYRALDFLLENGLIHRLASRNAFIACGHGHREAEPVAFLICETCGSVTETTSPALQSQLGALVAAHGFVAKTKMIEVSGLCAACAPSR